MVSPTRNQLLPVVTAIQHVRQADAARGAIEGAAAAGVRIGIDQHRARQRIGAVGDHGMADALVAADIVQALDAEALGEGAAGVVRRRRVRIVGAGRSGRTR